MAVSNNVSFPWNVKNYSRAIRPRSVELYEEAVVVEGESDSLKEVIDEIADEEELSSLPTI